MSARGLVKMDEWMMKQTPSALLLGLHGMGLSRFLHPAAVCKGPTIVACRHDYGSRLFTASFFANKVQLLLLLQAGSSAQTGSGDIIWQIGNIAVC